MSCKGGRTRPINTKLPIDNQSVAALCNFFKKGLYCQIFPVNFAQIFRIFIEHFWMTTSAHNLARRRQGSISFLLQVGTERNHSSNNCGFCSNKIWKTFISRKPIWKYYWQMNLYLTIFLQHKVLWSWSFLFIPYKYLCISSVIFFFIQICQK